MRGKLIGPLTCLLATAALAGSEEPKAVSTTEPAITSGEAITLMGADGKKHLPLANVGQKATVLVFLMHDCPVTNATAPELTRLANEFTPRGIQFFRIYVLESAAEIDTHSREYGLTFPSLLDPKLELVQIAGATRAPEAAIISPEGPLLYRGRIDDRATKPGITRPIPSRSDLRLALEAVLAGQKPDPRFTPAIGCYLPRQIVNP